MPSSFLACSSYRAREAAFGCAAVVKSDAALFQVKRMRRIATALRPNAASRARQLLQGGGRVALGIVVDVEFAEGDLAAFAGVAGVVLHIYPGLEVQRLVAPGRADL